MIQLSDLTSLATPTTFDSTIKRELLRTAVKMKKYLAKADSNWRFCLTGF